MRKLFMPMLIVSLLTGCSKPITPSISTPNDQQPIETPKQVVSSESDNRRATLLAYATSQGFLQEKRGCESDVSIGSWPGYNSYSLTKTQTLFEVVCVRGAYQNSYVYFIVSAGNPETIEFVTFHRSDDAKNIFESIGGLTDYSSDTLTVTAKARGLGDCGQYAIYHLEQSKFILETLREMDCDDPSLMRNDIVIDPPNWPLQYQRSK